MIPNSIFKHFLLFLFLSIGINTLQAQNNGNTNTAWGVQADLYAVTVDTINGLHATWSNIGDAGRLNLFSPPRFYHVWIEQLQPNGQWIVPQTNAHFYVSDTTWTADAAHLLVDLFSPIRVRVAPFRLENTIQRIASPTAITGLVEHPEDARSSDAIVPISTIDVTCCVITVVVDTKPFTGTPPSNYVKLSTALGSPLTIPVTYNTTVASSLATYLALPTNVGKYVNIEIKQAYNYPITPTTTPFLYANAQTATVIAAKSVVSVNNTSLNNQLPQLVQSIYTRLKQNFNGSPTVDNMTIRIIAQ